MTDFVALIPARLASTRLPDKPLADIAGQPMVVRVAGQARASGARRVVVATDAPAIAGAVRAHGLECVLTRADHPSGTDRLAEAATALGLTADEIVVNVQGDEPLLLAALVADAAAALAAAPDCAIATAAHPIESLGDYLSPIVGKALHLLVDLDETTVDVQQKMQTPTAAAPASDAAADISGELKRQAKLIASNLEATQALQQQLSSIQTRIGSAAPAIANPTAVQRAAEAAADLAS